MEGPCKICCKKILQGNLRRPQEGLIESLNGSAQTTCLPLVLIKLVVSYSGWQLNFCRLGDVVDVLDSHDRWYQAEIVNFKYTSPSFDPHYLETKLLIDVHYLEWTSAWDEKMIIPHHSDLTCGLSEELVDEECKGVDLCCPFSRPPHYKSSDFVCNTTSSKKIIRITQPQSHLECLSYQTGDPIWIGSDYLPLSWIAGKYVRFKPSPLAGHLVESAGTTALSSHELASILPRICGCK